MIPKEPLRNPKGSLRIPKESLRIAKESLGIPKESFGILEISFGILKDPCGSFPTHMGSLRIPKEPFRIPKECLRISKKSLRIPEGPLRIPLGSCRTPRGAIHDTSKFSLPLQITTIARARAGPSVAPSTRAARARAPPGCRQGAARVRLDQDNIWSGHLRVSAGSARILPGSATRWRRVSRVSTGDRGRTLGAQFPSKKPAGVKTMEFH